MKTQTRIRIKEQPAYRLMTFDSYSHRRGVTLIELIIAMSAAFIVMLTTALLVYSGQKSWTKIYNNANAESTVGSLNTMVALGTLGRKSNRTDYRLYKLTGGKYNRVLPTGADPEEVVIGNSVEFRYWDTGLEPALMNTDKTATAYALFYLDSGNLKIDYGPYPPGGIDATGNRITGNNITTVTLIRNLTGVEFSHTTRTAAGDGKGCIRMKLTVTDPIDGSSKVILAATLMRNVWPQ